MANTVKNDDQIDKNSAPAGGRPQGPTQKRVRRQRAQRARRVRLMAMVVLIFALTLAASGMYVNQYDLLPGHTNFVEWWQQQFLDSARMAPVLPTTTAVVVGWSQDTPTPAAGPATPPPVNGQEVRLADGLRYVDVQVGAGREVTVARRIDVEYTVWLKSSSQKLDSTYDRQGNTLTIAVGAGQVIKGADEGVVGMREGGTRRLIVPPELGYGANGYPPIIPANETLIFDVTVVHVG